MNNERCTGAGDCTAEVHIHGCFADYGSAVCDSPEWHGSLMRDVKRGQQQLARNRTQPDPERTTP